MKTYVKGLGRLELNRVRADWRGRLRRWRRFPGNGPLIHNPFDKCKCAKCAKKETDQ